LGPGVYFQPGKQRGQPGIHAAALGSFQLLGLARRKLQLNGSELASDHRVIEHADLLAINKDGRIGHP
jgi:hypothetical protein